jgi:pyridoxine 4-dehydrogenase
MPFAESVEALAQLQREGKIRHIGLSNVTLTQLEAARKIVVIASVQNRFSIRDRTEADILKYCTQHNIAFIPYGPLDAHPLKHGTPLANAGGSLREIADRHGVQPYQIALAWLLHYAPNIILILGTTTIAHLEENIAAASIWLTPEEMQAARQS